MKVITYTPDTEEYKVMYACGECKLMVRGDEHEAEWCCACTVEGCPEVKLTGWTKCSNHLDEDRAALKAAERERYLALPVITWDELDEDFVVVGDDFVSDLQTARDQVRDYGIEDSYTAHPTVKGKAHLPDLCGYVEETLWEQYGDDHYDNLDAAMEAILLKAQSEIDALAPVLYEPDTSRRINLFPDQDLQE